MSTFYVWYARYDPGNYFGHRKVELKAHDMVAARLEVTEFLAMRAVRGPYEYIIEEVVDRVGPTLWEK